MTSSKTHAIGLYPFRSTNALQRKLPHHIRTPSAFCEASQLYLQKVLQLICFFFPKDFCFLACKNNLSHEKNPPTFHYTGCLIGILIIMVCYNPYITGYYNLLLYNPTNQGPFFHCSPVYCFGQVTAGSVISKEPLLASMGRTLHPSPHKSFKERELHSKNWNPQQ